MKWPGFREDLKNFWNRKWHQETKAERKATAGENRSFMIWKRIETVKRI